MAAGAQPGRDKWTRISFLIRAAVHLISLTGFFWSGRLELHCSFPLGPTFPSELCVSHPNTRESFDTTATQLRKHLLTFPRWGGGGSSDSQPSHRPGGSALFDRKTGGTRRRAGELASTRCHIPPEVRVYVSSRACPAYSIKEAHKCFTGGGIIMTELVNGVIKVVNTGLTP